MSTVKTIIRNLFSNLKLLTFILFFISTLSFGKSPKRKFFRKSNQFFKKYVQDGKVDFESLSKHQQKLNKLINYISDFPVSEADSSMREAFYINAYHIHLINNVLKNSKVEYPLEYKGLFSFFTFKIDGRTYTLNELETELIDESKDLRIYFILSSVSEGSVPLNDRAYKPGKLNKQFAKAMREVVNNPSHLRIVKNTSRILLSESFKNSVYNFSQQELFHILNVYREQPLPEGYIIEFYPAKRKLNSL